jgi:hypothetical protein
MLVDVAGLEEWAKKRQAQGAVISVTVQLFNPKGPAFATTTKFRDLTELENQRRQNLADPAYQRPNPLDKSELYEVLVSLQEPSRTSLLGRITPGTPMKAPSGRSRSRGMKQNATPFSRPVGGSWTKSTLIWSCVGTT